MPFGLFALPLIAATTGRPEPPVARPDGGPLAIRGELRPRPPYGSAGDPEATLGYPIGSRITTYRDQERALDALERAYPRRLRKLEYGRSVEGRPLRVYFAASEKNLARLDAILAANARVAEEGASIPSDLPAIVWINQGIHGNEPASFESAMMLLYNLAASRSGSLGAALDKVVVVVNPSFNPDGHERYAVWYGSVARGEAEPAAFEASEPSAMWGRTNHYRFDLNRDRVSMTQEETRAEIALFNRVRPQVYADQHGQVESYFFPPNPMSVLAETDRSRIEKWTSVFGRGTAKAFDAAGFGYFVRREFDLYYPGYTDSFTSLAGAIGMTHETDGGKTLARTRADDSVVTLREGAAKHLASALAVIETAAANRNDLLASYADFKRKAREAVGAGEYRRVVVAGDPRALERLRLQLERMGVRSGLIGAGYAATARDYWNADATPARVEFPAGSLLVDSAQPNGALARAMLTAASDFEPEFTKAQLGKEGAVAKGEKYPGPEGEEFYDTTAWSLPLAHSLRAWRTADAGKLPAYRAPEGNRGLAPSSVGYALRVRDREDLLAAAEVRRKGVRLGIVTRPTVLGGVRYERGDLFALADRNRETDLRGLLTRIPVRWSPLSSGYPDEGTREAPGSESVGAMRPPKIAVAFGESGRMANMGGVWWTLEREFRLPFDAVRTSALGTPATADYTAIVLPPGAGDAASRLKEWVRAGGVLVILGDSSGDSASGLERRSTRTRSLPGALVRATVDPRPLLTAGYGTLERPAEIAFPVSGETFLEPKKDGGSFVRVATKGIFLQGWSFGEESEKALAGAALVHDEPLGRGHIVTFESDPTERGLYPGLDRMLLNALLLLPGN